MGKRVCAPGLAPARLLGGLLLLLAHLQPCVAAPQRRQRLQHFSWAGWQPQHSSSRRLLQPAFPDGPSAVTIVGGTDPEGQREVLGSAGGSTNSSSGGSDGGGRAAASDTVQVELKSATVNASCPTITIYLRAMQVIHPLVDLPGSEVLVRCQTNTGRLYRWYTIPLDTAYQRGYSDAKFSLQLAVAQLKCGESMSCRVGGQWPQADGTTAAAVLFDWGSSGCWFQYSHFTSLEQGSPLWSCKDPLAGEYVLQCAECSAGAGAGGPSQPTQPGGGQGGGRGTPINPTVIIIATCVCSATAILVGLALLVRHRRRTRSMNARIVELLRRAEGRDREHRHSPPPGFKPPPLYQLDAAWGGPAVEGEEGGEGVSPQLPKDNPPRPGYKGPIVVWQPCYAGGADLGESMAQGSVVLAKADLGEEGHRHRHRRHRRRRLPQQLPFFEGVHLAAVLGPAAAAASPAGASPTGALPAGDAPETSASAALRGGPAAGGDGADGGWPAASASEGGQGQADVGPAPDIRSPAAATLGEEEGRIAARAAAERALGRAQRAVSARGLQMRQLWAAMMAAEEATAATGRPR